MVDALAGGQPAAQYLLHDQAMLALEAATGTHDNGVAAAVDVAVTDRLRAVVCAAHSPVPRLAGLVAALRWRAAPRLTAARASASHAS